MDARTDIHRPSADEFDPEAYDLWGCFDLFPEWPNPGENEYRSNLIRKLRDDGYKIGAHGYGQCGHCGARIRYAALMVHKGAKEYIWIGEICLDNRFEMTQAEFKQLRETARLNRERMARKDRIAQFYEDHPLLIWLSYAPVITNSRGYVNGFLCDLYHKLIKYGELSDRQIAAAERVIIENTKRDDEQAELDKAAAVALAVMLASGVKCPEGRVEIEGEIVSVKEYDGYMPGTSSWKMLVVTSEGWKVWGTRPDAIWQAEKGDRVRFTATVTPSEDDQLFGKFKRPTKAEVLS